MSHVQFEGWEDVHSRIHLAYDESADYFRLRLTGSGGRVLLDLNVSYCAAEAHETFYRDLLQYLWDQLWRVDHYGIPTDMMDAYDENLKLMLIGCRSEPAQLPDEVVRELFEDVDAEAERAAMEAKELLAEQRRQDTRRAELLEALRVLDVEMQDTKQQLAVLEARQGGEDDEDDEDDELSLREMHLRVLGVKMQDTK